MDIKQCTKCEFILTLAEFPKKTGSKDGTRNICEKCHKLYSQAYYKVNKKNILKKSKIYREVNKETIREKDRLRKIELKSDPSKYDKYKKRYNKWYNKRLKTNPQFKLKIYMRNRIKSALKNDAAIKSDITMNLLGCNIDILKEHLSEQFENKMNWKNFGEWHVDHIIPLSAFDFDEVEHQKVAFHYSNLQPLWAKENLQKGDSLPNKFDLNNYVKQTMRKIYG